MQLKNNKNQKLFLTHTLIREFFYSLWKLGWVFLLVNGTSLLVLLTGILLYRFFSSHFLLYFSRKYFSKLDFQSQALISILVQSLFLISFLFANDGLIFFAITILLSCLSEIFYWPLRNNIQRLSVKNKKLGRNVALTKNSKNLAVIFWYLISGVWLVFEPTITLLIGSLWMFLSYIPLSKITIKNLWKWDDKFIKSFFNYKEKLSILKKHSSVTSYLLIWLIIELVNWIIPILLVYYGATIIELWIILVVVQVVSIFFHYIVWKFEDLDVKYILNGSIILLLVIFILFAFLDNTYLSILLVLFSILWIWIEIWITSKAQKLIKSNYSKFDGGYVLVWASNLWRTLVLPVILILYFFKDLVSFHTMILFYWFFALLLIFILNNNFKKSWTMK